MLTDVFDGVLKPPFDQSSPIPVRFEDFHLPGKLGEDGPDGIATLPWHPQEVTFLVHETDHGYDDRFLLTEAERKAHPGTKYASVLAAETGTGALVDWYEAVKQTETYRNLVDMRARAEARLKEDVRLGDSSGRSKRIVDAFDYLLKPQELFARSLTQFTANVQGTVK